MPALRVDPHALSPHGVGTVVEKRCVCVSPRLSPRGPRRRALSGCRLDDRSDFGRATLATWVADRHGGGTSVELVLKRDRSGCRRAWGLGAGVLACLAVAACQPSEVPDAEIAEPAEVVVAWVDGERVGVEDVLIARRRGGGADLDSRIELAVLDRVASLEARRRKLHQRPKVERALRDTRREIRRRELEILRTALKQESVQDVEISEQELRQAYEEDERSYLERQLRFRRWSFESEEQARVSGYRAPGQTAGA